MILTADQIADTYEARRKQYSDLHSSMGKVRDTYNGDITIDLPEFDGQTKPPVPNLLAQGVDQMAGRIASVAPTVTVVPERADRTAERRATTAAKVFTGWWAADRLNIKMTARARDLTAYGLTICQMGWNAQQNRPTWTVRSPLASYPSADITVDQQQPRNAIFAYTRTVGWLRANGYPYPVPRMGQFTEDWDNRPVTLLEYVDDTHRILTYYQADQYNGRQTRIIEMVEHGYGCTPVTVTPRVGLDRLAGQFDQMLSMYESQARLMALEIIAVEKGVFPDTYLVSRPGEIGRFIDGPHDGRTGKVNVVAGGDIRTEQPQPGYLTNPTIDRLERNQRVTAGIPAEFGGEAASNIRTGRRGDAVLSATIDMSIAYAQQLIGCALETENQIAAKMSKRHDGGRTVILTAAYAAGDRPVKYDPEIVFTSEHNSVTYPASGSDVNALIVGIGQRVGLGTMSKRTAGQIDPYIADPEREHDQIIAEGLEQSLLAGIQQQAASGQLPPLVLAKIKRLVETDRMELAEAMVKVAEDAAKEAQKEAQAEQPNTAEQMMAGPAAQALSGNPAALEQPSPIPGLGQGMSDLSGMLTSLRMPQQGLRPTVGVGGRA